MRNQPSTPLSLQPTTPKTSTLLSHHVSPCRPSNSSSRPRGTRLPSSTRPHTGRLRLAVVRLALEGVRIVPTRNRYPPAISASRTSARELVGRRGRHTDDDINQNTQTPLQIITLLVFQEVAHDDDGQDQDDDVEDFEIEIHALVQAPAHYHHQGGVEERCLNRRTQNMRQGEVHLVIPGFVNGSEVLRYLFDEGDEDETHKGVGDVVGADDEVDFGDEEDGVEGDAGEGDDEGDDAFGEGELVFGEVDVPVVVALFVFFEDGVVEGVVGSHLEVDVAGGCQSVFSRANGGRGGHEECYHENHRGDPADV